jgi:hypothetical protein
MSAGQRPASQTPAEIVARALADYGDPYPEHRALGILLVLKGQGYTLVRHYRSTDPDGTPLRYCATCFEDWPCSSSPAEEWVSARHVHEYPNGGRVGYSIHSGRASDTPEED